MYLDNKYTKWYYSIIKNRTLNPLSKTDYGEKHHIIPKSLGGDNSKTNIVRLTAKEHFICHLLLVKMTEGKNKAKMAYAIRCLSKAINNQQQRHKISSRSYNLVIILTREILSEKSKGKNNKFYGKKHTIETRKKMSILRKERIKAGTKEGHRTLHNNETKNRIREKNRLQFLDPKQREMRREWMKNKKWYHNPETKERNFFIEGTSPQGWIRGMGERKER